MRKGKTKEILKTDLEFKKLREREEKEGRLDWKERISLFKRITKEADMDLDKTFKRFRKLDKTEREEPYKKEDKIAWL